MKYIKKILANGLTIILVPEKRQNIVAAGFFIKAGSIDESDENNGMAHFLEHMMFKSTKNRTSDEIFRQLDVIGAEYNAITTMENTYYYLYGNSADTKKIIDIILDIYVNPIFNTGEINKEKKVIIEEMRMRFDRPHMKLYSAMHSKIFEGTPLARDIIGTAENVIGFTKKDFIEFRNKLYQPESTVIVVTGNFNPNLVYKWINKSVKSLKNSDTNYEEETTRQCDDLDYEPVSMQEVINENMKKQMEPYIYIKPDRTMEQAYLFLAFPLFDYYNKYYREIDLIGHILTSGFSSRLYRELRTKKGITYASDAAPFVYSSGGVFLITTTMHPDELVLGIKILLRELGKLKKYEIEKDELKKVINIANNEYLFSMTKPTDKLFYYGLNFLENREFKPDPHRVEKKLKNIKAEKIQQVANYIFTKPKINIFLYGNVDKNMDFNFLKL